MRHFLLLLLFFVVQAHAVCNRPVDQSKAVVFVNMNSTFLELDAAERAACQRGERFVAIPPLNAALAEYRRYYLPWIYGIDRNNALTRAGRTMPPAEYQVLVNNFQKKNRAKAALPEVNKAYLEAQLRTLAASNISVKSFVISGHDGGETMGGDMGMIAKNDVMTALKSAYSGAKAPLLNGMTSMLHWGCYTATPAEVMRMKRNFPSLKVVGGFNGGGPLSIRGASYSLMEDLLKEERHLTSATSSQEVRRLITGLDEVTTGTGAVFVTACDDEFYYQRGPFGRGFGRFEEFRGCPAEVRAQLATYSEEFEKYVYGTTALPTDLANNSLRGIYSYTRQYQHCIDRDSTINPNRVGLIHWSAGVLKNFEQTFKPGLSNGMIELNRLLNLTNGQMATMFPGVDPTMVRDLLNKLAPNKEMIKKLFTSPGGVSTMNRSQILQAVHKLEGLMSHPAMRTPSSQAKFPWLNRLKNVMNRYVVRADPACMDFLHWHDFIPGQIAPALCRM